MGICKLNLPRHDTPLKGVAVKTVASVTRKAIKFIRLLVSVDPRVGNHALRFRKGHYTSQAT